jgi:hypothetical protein
MCIYIPIDEVSSQLGEDRQVHRVWGQVVTDTQLLCHRQQPSFDLLVCICVVSVYIQYNCVYYYDT